MRQTTITAFLDSLADRTPAPGGGATTALHLGQAAALMSMVARYSTGPRYSEHAAVIDGICSAADAESLVDEVTRLGDTRHYAKRTFLVFVVIAMLLAVVSVVIASK